MTGTSRRAPVSSAAHWADATAERVVRARGARERYVIAAGVAPSGTVTFGHLREVMSGELVARALRDRGLQVRFIYSWDDYDVFRKVPKNLPQQDMLAAHLRKPVVDVPDPFGGAPSFAARFELALEQVLPQLGIDAEYLYQAARYRQCAYRAGIRAALGARDTIRALLDEHRTTPLPEDYWPITVYSPLDGTDRTEVLAWDGADQVTFRDVDGSEKQLDLASDGAAKLLWRIDWPMRWAHEGVDCEPAGKDHHSAGGSFDTGKEIARQVYGYEPPVTFLYGDIGIKGGAGRLSSSSGNVLTIDDVLAVYQPEVVRYLYAGTRPNAEFVVSFDADVIKIYEDYDRSERIYYGTETVSERRRDRERRIYELSQLGEVRPELAPQVPFRHLCNLIQLRNGDLDGTVAELQQAHDLDPDAVRRLSARCRCAWTWVNEHAPEAMRFRLRTPQAATPARLDAAQAAALGQLHAEVLRLEHHDAKSLAARIFAIAEEQSLPAKALFAAAYQALIGKDQGPRLAEFILLSGADRIAPLLAPYA